MKMKKPEEVKEFCGIEQLSAKKIKKYVDNAGQHCPKCESIVITANHGTCERIGAICYENVSCEECGFEWTDEYTLSGITQ